MTGSVTPLIRDSRAYSPEVREQVALRAKQAADIGFPPLACWNSSPCARHAELTRGCQECGIALGRHQRVGASWLYWTYRGLLADSVGLGKTAQVGAVLALCKETGELSYSNRAVIVCKAAAVEQWARELRRMIPSLQVLTANDPLLRRSSAYFSGWEVCVISDRTLSPSGKGRNARDGDVEILRQFAIGTVVFDDTDAMRSSDTRTFYAVCRLAEQATRVYGVHGTPLQKRLAELYCFLVPLGGRAVFGTLSGFKQRYVTRGKMYLWVRDKTDRTGRRKKKITIWRDIGVKEYNLPEFKRLLYPFVLRRTVADLDGDVTLPKVLPNTVYIELSARQRARYDELRQGVLRRLREAGEEVTKAEAAAAFVRGQQICSGLAALDDGQDDSAKLDWVMDKLTGDLSGEKVICFVYFKPNVAALAARLEAEGIGHVLVWSEETSPKVREQRVQRFMTDPACQVLVGTTTIEQSLNLQAASHLIAVDTILNAARFEQLLGRARRQGSPHRRVVFHHLLATGTQEDAYLELLEREAAMAGAVWEDRSDIFTQLTPRQQMLVVAHGTLAA